MKGRKRGSEGRKETRERTVSTHQHSNAKKKQRGNTAESAREMKQGHGDMCSFDDKEIRHKKE